MNRKLRRADAARKKKTPKVVSQLEQALKGLDGVGDAAAKLEPLLEEVEQQRERLASTQEALEMAIDAVQAQGQQIKDQRTTFLWLLAEVLPHVDLETLEARFDQAYNTLQGRKA